MGLSSNVHSFGIGDAGVSKNTLALSESIPSRREPAAPEFSSTIALPSPHAIPDTAHAVGMAGVLNAVQTPAFVLPLDSTPMVFVGSAQLMEETNPGSRVMYEGWLIDSDEEPRPVAKTVSSPRKRNAPESNVVLDLLLVDLTGPMAVTLWGDSVEKFLQLRLALARMGASGAKSLLKLEVLRVKDVTKNAFHGEVLTPMKVLHSMVGIPNRPGTEITLSPDPTSPFTKTAIFRAPLPPLCIVNFAAYQSKMVPPFRATLRGVVADLKAVEATEQGNPKRCFALVDDMGFWVTCHAIGRNAQSPALVDTNDVVIFYASARKGLGSSVGAMYLFKDALVVAMGKKSVQKRVQIEFTESM